MSPSTWPPAPTARSPCSGRAVSRPCVVCRSSAGSSSCARPTGAPAREWSTPCRPTAPSSMRSGRPSLPTTTCSWGSPWTGRRPCTTPTGSTGVVAAPTPWCCAAGSTWWPPACAATSCAPSTPPIRTMVPRSTATSATSWGPPTCSSSRSSSGSSPSSWPPPRPAGAPIPAPASFTASSAAR